MLVPDPHDLATTNHWSLQARYAGQFGPVFLFTGWHAFFFEHHSIFNAECYNETATFLGTIDCFLITTKLICNLMIFFSVLRCFTNNSIHIVTKQSFLRLESNYNNQYSSDLEHESYYESLL